MPHCYYFVVQTAVANFKSYTTRLRLKDGRAQSRESKGFMPNRKEDTAAVLPKKSACNGGLCTVCD